MSVTVTRCVRAETAGAREVSGGLAEGGRLGGAPPGEEGGDGSVGNSGWGEDGSEGGISGPVICARAENGDRVAQLTRVTVASARPNT